MELFLPVLDQPQELEACAAPGRPRGHEYRGEVLVLDAGPVDHPILQPWRVGLEAALRPLLDRAPLRIEHSEAGVGILPLLLTVVRAEPAAPHQRRRERAAAVLGREPHVGEVRSVRQMERLRRRQAPAVTPCERDFREGRAALRSLASGDAVERFLQALRSVRIFQQELQRQVIERSPGVRNQLERMTGVVRIFLEPPGRHARAAVGQADSDQRRFDRDLFFGGGLDARAGGDIGTRGRSAGRGASDAGEAGSAADRARQARRLGGARPRSGLGRGSGCVGRNGGCPAGRLRREDRPPDDQEPDGQNDEQNRPPVHQRTGS